MLALALSMLTGDRLPVKAIDQCTARAAAVTGTTTSRLTHDAPNVRSLAQCLAQRFAPVA